MKENKEEVLEKMERLAAEIEANPATRAFRESEQAATLEKRKEAAAKIADLQIDMEATGVLQREIDGMVDRLSVMEHERCELLDEIRRRRYTLAKEKSGIEVDISQAKAVLLTTYDRHIDEEIDYFRERFEALRNRGVSNHLQNESDIEIVTSTTFSTAGSIQRALAYYMTAIKELEIMRLEPVFDPLKISRLRAEQPDAALFEDYSATKERFHDDPSPGRNAAIRQATDNLSDLTTKNLLEKVTKLLKPKRSR